MIDQDQLLIQAVEDKTNTIDDIYWRRWIEIHKAYDDDLLGYALHLCRALLVDTPESKSCLDFMEMAQMKLDRLNDELNSARC